MRNRIQQKNDDERRVRLADMSIWMRERQNEESSDERG